MILRVADEDGAVGVNEDAVRAGEAAFERVALRPVPFLPGSCDQLDGAAGGVDRADRVALGVGEIDAAIGPDAEALGPRERRGQRRPAVAGETRFTGAG